MPDVALRPVTVNNLGTVLALDVGQRTLVASTMKSMAQAAVDDRLTPLVAYDVRCRGVDRPDEPAVGLTMLEFVGGVGFIQRLMVDRRFQRQGYGMALLRAIVRKLRLAPRGGGDRHQPPRGEHRNGSADPYGWLRRLGRAVDRE